MCALPERRGGHGSFRTLHNTLANMCVCVYVNMFVQNKTRKPKAVPADVEAGARGAVPPPPPPS